MNRVSAGGCSKHFLADGWAERQELNSADLESRDEVAYMSNILENLTDAQRAAVTHVDGPMLVLAGPGSGKTRVVTHRIAYLLDQGIPDYQILALTFTNKAADEMRQRLERLAPGQRVWVSTFHRFCSRLLRQYAPLVGLAENFSIYDTSDSGSTLTRAIEQSDVDISYYSEERIAKAISTAKAATITPEQYEASPGRPFAHVVAQIYPIYQRQLLLANAVDFDDLLLHVATILRENPDLRSQLDDRFRYILVDEYQDTNLAQYAIVRALSVEHPNLAVTGDPDQSIYGWRGANLNNILEFEHDYPNTRVVRLEENFRSTQRIVRVAAELIAHNVRRKRKTLFTSNPEGALVRVARYPSYLEEADDIAEQIERELREGKRAARDFAIFYRTNAISRSLEHALRSRAIPYQVVHGVAFYQRKEIKDVLAYLQLLNNPRDDAALLRIINVPPRSIGKQTVSRLVRFAAEHRMPLLDAAADPRLHAALGKRPTAAVRMFLDIYQRLARIVDQPMEAIIGSVLDYTNYLDYLKENSDKTPEDRADNVQEFLSEAREFDARHPEGPWLEMFLERAALVNDTDDWDEQSSKVSLMTLHAAKGLEFPVVYIVGVEQGLLPHERNRESDEGMEEERRLLFVGITRAREQLQLSCATKRLRGGTIVRNPSSSFLLELPRGDIEHIGFSDFEPIEGGFDDRPEFETDDWSQETGDAYSDVLDEPPVRAKPKKKPRRSAAPRFRTASEMLGKQPAGSDSRPDVEAFSQGMIVNHPEYGLGAIVSLSGEGMKRSAKVRFFDGDRGEQQFFLAYSPLTPVRSDSG